MHEGVKEEFFAQHNTRTITSMDTTRAIVEACVKAGYVDDYMHSRGVPRLRPTAASITTHKLRETLSREGTLVS